MERLGWRRAALAVLLVGGAMVAPGQAQVGSGHAGHGDHSAHAGHAGHTGHAARAAPGSVTDSRQAVAFPPLLKAHTLANMRDHLLALTEIQEHLAAGAWDKAAATAETRLGMASLQSHGAHDVARHMPEGMQQAGSAMHQAASRFARVATDGSVTGDTRGALKALSEVSRTCVACHAAYRLQ